MTNWQPITTAPKDEVVLIHDEGYVGKAMLQEGRWLDVECGRDDAFFDPQPQHWMPLPPPPVVLEDVRVTELVDAGSI